MRTVFERTFCRREYIGRGFNVLWAIACMQLCLCIAPIKQFYADTFYPEDNVYENEGLGFVLRFRGNWSIVTDPEQMNKHYKAFAQNMQNAGGELLFMGSTVEGLYGVKAIALNLNEPPDEYAHYIRELNINEIDSDSEPIDFIAGDHIMAKWIYDKSGYRFVEFFFVVGTYDIRLSFWTKPDLFNNFLSVFEDIVSSFSLTADFK